MDKWTQDHTHTVKLYVEQHQADGQAQLHLVLKNPP